MHKLLRRSWRLADQWTVGRYMIMPDHIHLFCAPGDQTEAEVGGWVTYWKGLVARAVKGHGALAGEAVAGYPSGGSPSSLCECRLGSRDTRWPDVLWQRDFWDSQLRRTESYEEKWNYVCENPVRAGLCGCSNSWVFQGEMSSLAW